MFRSLPRAPALPEIIKPQSALEACHDELQEFRNNVAFHSRAEVEAHIKARTKLRGGDVFLDLTSGITDFLHLMERLEGEELEAIPELPGVLEQMRVSHLPAFKRVQEGQRRPDDPRRDPKRGF